MAGAAGGRFRSDEQTNQNHGKSPNAVLGCWGGGGPARCWGRPFEPLRRASKSLVWGLPNSAPCNAVLLFLPLLLLLRGHDFVTGTDALCRVAVGGPGASSIANRQGLFWWLCWLEHGGSMLRGCVSGMVAAAVQRESEAVWDGVRRPVGDTVICQKRVSGPEVGAFAHALQR